MLPNSTQKSESRLPQIELTVIATGKFVDESTY